MAYVQYLELSKTLPEIDKEILRFKIQAVLQLWLLFGLYIDEKIVTWANWNQRVRFMNYCIFFLGFSVLTSYNFFYMQKR